MIKKLFCQIIILPFWLRRATFSAQKFRKAEACGLGFFILIQQELLENGVGI
jgi:hypothetical protein